MPKASSLLLSKCCAYTIAVILLFSEIMPLHSCYLKAGLVYVVIIALFSCQLSACSKYTKVNMRLFYNIYLVFNAKCIYRIIFCIHLVLCLIYYRVLYAVIGQET